MDFTFYVPVIKNNHVRTSFYKGKWSLRKNYEVLETMNLGDRWKEVWESHLSSRLEKRLLQLELEVRKKVCIIKGGRCFFKTQNMVKSEVVFSCFTLKQVTGDIQILFSASKALISWWCSSLVLAYSYFCVTSLLFFYLLTKR